MSLFESSIQTDLSAQRELMLSPPVWSIGVIGNRYKLRNRYYKYAILSIVVRMCGFTGV